MTEESAKTLIHATVTSRLDYGNALLCGISEELLDKLQRIQNSAARIVTGAGKRDHITPILHKLHWLPIRSRIQFKILLWVYKALNNQAPKYILDLLTTKNTCRNLRSSSENFLAVPKSYLKHAGDRAFSVYAPQCWNALARSIRNALSLQVFKGHLKTYLFRKAYESI